MSGMLRKLTAPKMCSVFSPIALNMIGLSSVSQPFPIDQPNTPNALPFARTSSGNVSVGYTHGIVSHVAPKMKV